MAQAQTSIPDLLPKDDSTTPLMAQYFALKAQHANCLLFFRLGDFYEMFFDDAVQAAAVLDITLTRRGQHQGQDIPMCGVPAHAHEAYLAKLIRHGFHVALCEQTEDPASAKKRGYKAIVTREVVRVVTPGTVTEESLLDARIANHLCCLVAMGDDLAVSWLDIASGRPYSQSLDVMELGSTLARLEPSELLVAENLIDKPEFFETLRPWRENLTRQPQSRFDSVNAERRLQALYKVKELDAFGEFTRAEVAALGTLIDYLALTQKSDLSHLMPPIKIEKTEGMVIDPSTRRNLELTRTLSGERAGSLLAAIDRTGTGAGARLLTHRLMMPLTDVVLIQARLDAVSKLFHETSLRQKLRQTLQHAPDLERALARLAMGRGGPRDLAGVSGALRAAYNLRTALEAAHDLTAVDIQNQIRDLGDHAALKDFLTRALAEDLPVLARDGNFIARGFSAELDECVVLRDDSRRLVAALQQKYADSAGVTNLKIRHNMVIGYHIEVNPNQTERLRAQKDLFIHRQTLATAARFTTVELTEIERKITDAADKALALELQIFSNLTETVLNALPELRRVADAMAALDVTASLAEVAVEQSFTRPEVDTSFDFQIIGGRHPVVEQALRSSPQGTRFFANNCDLAPSRYLWLLTGPNMAGKSTFLRQNALIAILAQIGSFVPAEKCRLGFVDRVFSRVGAADNLARGQSTFMVEMVETAAILNQAGPRALVILDEIGRGTSTYDGLSIAWATLEHLHNTTKCRALFATHYHELTSLVSTLPALACHTMNIKEWQGEIIFLHEVIVGVADRSYGIHVAQMAGLPPTVIARATEILIGLEADRKNYKVVPAAYERPRAKTHADAQSKNDELEKTLRMLKPDEMTAKQALDILYKLVSLQDGNKVV